MTRRVRALATLAVLTVALFAGGLLAAPPAGAHPLGNFTINRYSGLVLSPGRIDVTYVLDLAEIPAFQEMAAIDADGDGAAGSRELDAYAGTKAAELLSGVSLTVDGRAVTLSVASSSARLLPGQAGLDTLRVEASLRADLPSGHGSGRYRDRNYVDRIGWKEITVRSVDGVAIGGSTVPPASVSKELTAYPVDLLSSPLNVTEASFSFAPGAATSAAELEPSGHTVSGAPVASGGAFAGLVTWRLTPLVLILSLLAAFAFGALHALGPGHGKTITAAYLVGTEARMRQAVAVGAAVAVMHSASVLALGLILFVLARSFPTEQVYPWLTLATGVVALGLGAGLFVARLRAARAGREPWHGHTHPWHPDGHAPAHHHHHPPTPGHAHAAEHDDVRGGVLVLERTALEVAVDDDVDLDVPLLEIPADGPPHPRPLSSRGLLALAVAGGLLPSPTAFVVLTGAINAHRIGYGLALIAAFSLGLAAALIVVGLVALRARAAMATRLRGRWAAVVPVLSAVVIAGFGAFFALRGLAQLG